MATIAKNKRAFFDYAILESFQAGLVLTGSEVKSAKKGNVSFVDSYLSVNPHGPVILRKFHIGPYTYSSEKYNPLRDRIVLLEKKEVAQLRGRPKGTTVIPLELFVTNRGLIKLSIGIAQSRKKHDKREYIKKREAEKEIRTAL